MNQIDKAAARIAARHGERMRRLEVLKEVIGDRADVTDQEIEVMIGRVYADLKTWPVEKLLNEFVSADEMIIRGLSEKI